MGKIKIGIHAWFRIQKKSHEDKITRNKPATKVDRKALKKDVAKHPDAYQYERARTVSARSLGIFTPISIPLSILGLNVSFSKGLYIVLSTPFLIAMNCSNSLCLWR